MAFDNLLRAGRTRREFLARQRPGGRLDLNTRDLPAGMRWPAGKGLNLDYSSIRPEPAATTSEYVSPEPRQPEARAGGLSEGARRTLGAALRGASYGIRADVGPARPGSGFSQGILKGIVGAGMAQADMERAAAAGEQERLSQAGKLALAEARRETPEEAGAKAEEVAKRTQKYKLELQQSSAALKDATEKVMAERKAGMTDAQLAQMNRDVEKEMNDWFLGSYKFNPSEDEKYRKRKEIKESFLSGFKTTPKVTEVIPKLPE